MGAAPYARSQMQECNAEPMVYTDTECTTALSSDPTMSPVAATDSPSMRPSVTPSMSPSNAPTTPAPSKAPTPAPTMNPTATMNPTKMPSMNPTMMPTEGVPALTYLSGCDNTTPAPDSSVARFGGVLAVSMAVVLALWM